MTAENVEQNWIEELRARLNDQDKRTVSNIISCVARYPQTLIPKHMIIKRALQDVVRPANKRAINFKTLQKLFHEEYRPSQEEKEFCSGKVNTIHKRFHIPREVTPEEAINIVTTFAYEGFSGLFVLLKKVLAEKGAELPKSLSNPDHIHTPNNLEQFLRSNRDVLQAAIDAVSITVEKYEPDTKRWQQEQRKIYTGEELEYHPDLRADEE